MLSRLFPHGCARYEELPRLGNRWNGLCAWLAAQGYSDDALRRRVQAGPLLEAILQANNAWLRYQLEGVIDFYGLDFLETTEPAEELAEAYVQAEAFTERNYPDSLHVALAVVARHEVVVSWNFRHIVRACGAVWAAYA